MISIEQFACRKLNLYYEIAPAKTNPRIERQMVKKLFNDPENTFSIFECRQYVHELVHVMKHYVATPELLKLLSPKDEQP